VKHGIGSTSSCPAAALAEIDQSWSPLDSLHALDPPCRGFTPAPEIVPQARVWVDLDPVPAFPVWFSPARSPTGRRRSPLVESNRKKGGFLRECARTLGVLPLCTPVESRTLSRAAGSDSMS